MCASRRFENVENVVSHEEISEAAVVAEAEERTTVFIWLLVFCASISGLLFGMDPLNNDVMQPH